MTVLSDRRSTILAIDDSVDIHRLLQIRLRDQNVEIISAYNGQEGIELARTRQPDLILLDLHMAEMDGFAAMEHLKHDAATSEIPIIILSGSDEITDKVRGFDLGAVDFITKPFNLPELRARVRSALRMHWLVQLLEQKAQIDGLTGLWNRAYLDNRIEEQIAGAQRHESTLSLVLCDLDHFKRVNDSYGHPFGDQVLREFADLLTTVSRKSDICCRYGGEEFAVILPEIDAAHGAQAAERYRLALEGHSWPGHDDLTVTASFGISCLASLVQPTASELLSAADRALYQAKSAGRNCLRVAQAQEDQSSCRHIKRPA